MLWTDIVSIFLQDRQGKFSRRAIYGMIDGSQNTIFSWWKQPQWSRKIKNGGNELAAALAAPARKKNSNINKRKRFKTKLYMYNTKGNVALTSISRETKYIHDLVHSPKWKFLAFPQPQYALSMFLNFGHFSASCSYRKVLLYQKKYTQTVRE